MNKVQAEGRKAKPEAGKRATGLFISCPLFPYLLSSPHLTIIHTPFTTIQPLPF